MSDLDLNAIEARAAAQSLDVDAVEREFKAISDPCARDALRACIECERRRSMTFCREGVPALIAEVRRLRIQCEPPGEMVGRGATASAAADRCGLSSRATLRRIIEKLDMLHP